jgi:hypothetical protein
VPEHSCYDGSFQPGRSCPRCTKAKRSPSSGTSHARAKLKRRLQLKHPLCQVGCGNPSTILHHIKAMAERPDLVSEESNALMLDHRCHKLADNGGATLAELRAMAGIAGIIGSLS